MVILTRQQMLYHQKVIWDQVIQLVTDTVVTKVYWYVLPDLDTMNALIV